MIRVLIVDDEPLIAEAHKTYVERTPGFEVAGVAHTGASAMRFASTEAVDLVLLDIGLPDASGIDVAAALGGLRPSPDVIADERVSTPKGIAPQTMDGITASIKEAADGLNASEAAKVVGVSRVTAWRYLERLADDGLVTRHTEYGKAGRPQVRYVWR